MKPDQQIEPGEVEPTMLDEPQQIESTEKKEVPYEPPDPAGDFPETDPEQVMTTDPAENTELSPEAPDPEGGEPGWEPDLQAISNDAVRRAQELAEFERKRFNDASGRYGGELQRLRQEIEQLRAGQQQVPQPGYTPQYVNDPQPQQGSTWNVPPNGGSQPGPSEQEQFYAEQRVQLKMQQNQQHWDQTYRQFWSDSKLATAPEEIQQAVVGYVQQHHDQLQQEMRGGDAGSIQQVGNYLLAMGLQKAIADRHTRLTSQSEQSRQQAVRRKMHATPPAQGGLGAATPQQTGMPSPEELEQLPREERKKQLEAYFAKREGRPNLS